VRRALPALLAAAALVAAGCETGFDEEKETARPLKVAHALGEAKVPGQAERPLMLTDGALDTTLALGVAPVAAALPGGEAPAYLRPRAEGLEVLGPLTAARIPEVEALDPDLILGSGAQDALYERLGTVAPTVMSEPHPGGHWQLDVRLFGEALGRTNAGERLLIDWDSRVAAARRALGERDDVAAVRAVRGGLRLAGLESFGGRLLADTQVAAALPDGAFRNLDPGRLRATGARIVLASAAPGSEAGLRALSASAARQGIRVVSVDDRLWWGGDGVLAARAALGDLERAAGA
jgi:iron complex transport system substrate-binding protein